MLSSSASRFTAGASDEVAGVRSLGFPGAWVKHSPPKRLRNASAVSGNSPRLRSSSKLSHGNLKLLPRLRACRKGTPGAYEEGIAGMLIIIKASLLGLALILLESCTGYLTNYQTPCVEGHVCECVRYTTVNRSWLDCRDYGRVKSRAY